MPQKKHVLVATLLLSLVAGLGVVTAPPANAASCAGLSDPNALQVHQGDMTVTQSGAVIENLEIRGTLRIQAPNVTVRNVWVYTSSFWTVYVDEKSNASLNIEYSEIGHPSHVGQRGIGGHNIRAKCIDIHHVEDGIKLGNNVVYDRIHVHHLASKSGSPHADAVQDDGGSRNAVVKNSTLNASSPLLSGNAAVIVKSDLGASRDITFVNNYLNGGAYVIFVRNGGHGMPQNVVFENNRIGDKFAYGVLSADGPVGWSGNVWASTGEPVDVGAQGAPAPRPTTTTTAPKPTTTAAPKPTTTKPKPTTTAPKPTTTTTTAPTTTTTEAPETTTTTSVELGELTAETTTTYRPSTTAAQALASGVEDTVVEAASPVEDGGPTPGEVRAGILLGVVGLASMAYAGVRHRRAG